MKLQKFLELLQPILKLVIGFLLNLNDYCVYTFDEIIRYIKIYKLLVTVSTCLLVKKVSFRKFYIDCKLSMKPFNIKDILDISHTVNGK